MRVDAVVAVLAAILAAALLLALYARGQRAESLAYDCYKCAQEVLAGSVTPDCQGFAQRATVIAHYPNGTSRVLRQGSQRYACYAYQLHPNMTLVEVRGG